MKQTEENGALRRISKEEVERIMNRRPVSMLCTCCSGSDDWGCRVVGCGEDDVYRRIDMGTGSGMGITRSQNPYKGIHLSDEVYQNEVLTQQILEALAASKPLLNLLSPFKNGQDDLTYVIRDLPSSTPMETTSSTQGHVTAINRKLIDGQYGFNGYTYGADQTGFEQDGTATSLFSVSMAHEAIHANHFRLYYEGSRMFGDNPTNRANYLIDNGYNEEFVNIFYQKTAEGWGNRNALEIDTLEHEYMKKHYHPFMEGVRNDFIHRYDSIHQ